MEVHLLLVEDEPLIAHSISIFLRPWRVVIAPTLEAGQREFRTGKYSAVILDLMLPDGDGSTLLREIRESGSDMRVVIASAMGYEREDELLRLGADTVLAKPFGLERLRAALS